MTPEQLIENQLEIISNYYTKQHEYYMARAHAAVNLYEPATDTNEEISSNLGFGFEDGVKPAPKTKAVKITDNYVKEKVAVITEPEREAYTKAKILFNMLTAVTNIKEDYS